ncbi:hypothetical protein BZL30_0090 [Mycobacterium kansasii]|uniref:Uncharacterized protein n=1 Tax=Mycobacterium kansasii TaxID=1768 RepID=A0A1V3XTR5_MYCKA|nr:hypothetical protein BZL30_0090 [Mycobacterium kansasii]
MIEARETDTRVSRVFDVAAGLPWPARYPSRVLANDFVAQWTGREDELAADPDARRGWPPRSLPKTCGWPRRCGAGRRDDR